MPLQVIHQSPAQAPEETFQGNTHIFRAGEFTLEGKQ